MEPETEKIEEAQEFKMYTPEQEEKIAQLRHAAEVEKYHKQFESKTPTKDRWTLEKGDDCTVRLNGITLVGNILDKRTRTGKYGSYITYDISTPLGVLKEFSNSYTEERFVRKRFKIDYSNVKVPEKLKTTYTQKLLWMLSIARLGGTYEWFNEKYTYEELKAELATRPHIPNKRERRVISEWQSKHK